MSTLANDSSANGAGGGQGGTNASSSSGIDNTDHATGTNGNDTSSGSGTLGEIPWAFIDCSTDTLMLLISHMLNLLIQHNDQVVLTPDALTRFHSRAAPGISVLEYLRRIVKYTNMEVIAHGQKIPLLSLLAYIDITCQHLPNFTLSSLTVHRFLIAGVCAGSKAQCDVFCTNAHYAKVGGIKVQELNALEREFLKVTQWNLCCNADLLQRYYTSLIRSHGGYTQAPEPSTPAFQAFPRSLSKPPSDDTDEEMSDEVAVDNADDSPEIPASPESSKRKSLDVTGMMVDTAADTSSEELAGQGRDSRTSSGSRHRVSPRPSKTADESMDVDVEGDRGRESSPVSPATSSIPSSSRSSIRGGSRGRGRAVSMSFSDARPAEPRLDKTPISASPFTTGRSPHRSPLQQNRQTVAGEVEEEHDEHDHSHHNHDHHHHHSGAHLLKSLVGGIFHRRKSSHNPDKPLAQPTRPDASRPTSTASATSASAGLSSGTNGTHPHNVLPSQPVRQPSNPYVTQSPLPADIPPPPKPQPATSVSVPTPPPPSAGQTNNVTLGAVPATLARNSSLTRSPRMTKSPGMAKPVTPRIRTHEEFGEHPAEPVHVLEGGIADDGKRRARVE